MKLVRARFGHQADGTGGLYAILRSGGAGLDLELLKRVRERHGQIAVVERIVVTRAVQRVIQTRVHSAGDRNIAPAERIPARRD